MRKEIRYDLDSLVSSFCEQLGESDARYNQYLAFALREVQELNKLFPNAFSGTKVAPLSINHLMEAEAPSDYVEWVSLYSDYQGRKLTFLHSDRISLETKEREEVRKSHPAIYDRYCGRYGLPVARKFGNGIISQAQGYFRYNPDRNTFVFNDSRARKCEILLEYRTSGVDNPGDIFVHPDAEEMIECGMLYRRSKFGRGASRLEQRTAKMDYEEAKYDFKRLHSTVTVQDFYDVISQPVR